MINWSLAKLKFTLGVGTLASVGLLRELSQQAIPAWAAVGIVLLPLAVFVFADPEDIPQPVARALQIGASLWYLVVNLILAVMFLVEGLTGAWYLLLVLLAVGAIPCLIVLGRGLGPAPIDDGDQQAALARLPGDSFEPIDVSRPAVHRPKAGKQLLMLLAGAALVGGGVLMIHQGYALGWLLVVFFGLGSVVFLLQLLPNSSYLRVSSDGLEVRSFWRVHRYQWTDISHFHAGTIGPTEMVLITFAPTHQCAQTGRALARTLTGAEGALPDTYGLTAEALAEQLNCWKAAHTPRDEPLPRNS